MKKRPRNINAVIRSHVVGLQQQNEALTMRCAMLEGYLRQAVSLRESLCASRGANCEAGDGYLLNWKEALE